MENTNSFVKKTCSFAKSVVRKTQELLETSQINLRIVKTKGKIEKLYANLGCCLYNKQKKDGLEEVKKCFEGENFKKVCEKIDKLQDELKRLREEYESTRKSYEEESKMSSDCSNCDVSEGRCKSFSNCSLSDNSQFDKNEIDKNEKENKPSSSSLSNKKYMKTKKDESGEKEKNNNSGDFSSEIISEENSIENSSSFSWDKYSSDYDKNSPQSSNPFNQKDIYKDESDGFNVKY